MALSTTVTAPELKNMPVAYRRLSGPQHRQVEHFDTNGASASLVIRVDYANRFKAANYIMGFPTILGTGGSGASVTVYKPMRHPDLAFLYATSVDIENAGARGDTVGGMGCNTPFSESFLTINFSTLQFTFDGGQPYSIITTQFSGQMQAIPNTGITVGGSQVEENVSIFVPQQEIQIRRVSIINIDYFNSTMSSLTGCVNNAAFAVGNNTYAAKTLLCLGASSEQTTTGLGAPQQSGTVSLTYRSIPWTQIMDNTGSWGEATITGSGGTIYPTADFTPLYSTY